MRWAERWEGHWEPETLASSDPEIALLFLLDD